MEVKPSKNRKSHRFLDPFSKLPAVKKDSKNRAARKYLGPSYFDPALVFGMSWIVHSRGVGGQDRVKFSPRSF